MGLSSSAPHTFTLHAGESPNPSAPRGAICACDLPVNPGRLTGELTMFSMPGGVYGDAEVSVNPPCPLCTVTLLYRSVNIGDHLEQSMVHRSTTRTVSDFRVKRPLMPCMELSESSPLRTRPRRHASKPRPFSVDHPSRAKSNEIRPPQLYIVKYLTLRIGDLPGRGELAVRGGVRTAGRGHGPRLIRL